MFHKHVSKYLFFHFKHFSLLLLFRKSTLWESCDPACADFQVLICATLSAFPLVEDVAATECGKKSLFQRRRKKRQSSSTDARDNLCFYNDMVILSVMLTNGA